MNERTRDTDRTVRWFRNNADNTFTAAATFFEVDNSLDTIFTGNTFPETAVVEVKNGACFVAGSDLGDTIGTPCV